MGRITDACRGDSGGPLFVQKKDHVELVAVLKVYICAVISHDYNYYDVSGGGI